MLLSLACAGSSEAATGGATAPDESAAPSKQAGGSPYDRRRAAWLRRPVLTSFVLRRPRLFLHGLPAKVTYRIRSRTRLASVRISVTPAGARRAAATIAVPPRQTGTVPLTGQEAGILPEGDYRLRISARDVRGRRLRRGAGISSSSDLSILHHRFPVGGPFDFGGADARFGAVRDGHTHQGQDLTAAEGTPLLAPRAGIVEAVQYQERGAGHYVVIDGVGEDRDYVFMHLRTGSVRVQEGQYVRTGQAIAEVGDTGRSSGAHLHFEIWEGGGWYGGGRPVDPLPMLKRWAAATRSRA